MVYERSEAKESLRNNNSHFLELNVVLQFFWWWSFSEFLCCLKLFECKLGSVYTMSLGVSPCFFSYKGFI